MLIKIINTLVQQVVSTLVIRMLLLVVLDTHTTHTPTHTTVTHTQVHTPHKPHTHLHTPHTHLHTPQLHTHRYTHHTSHTHTHTHTHHTHTPQYTHRYTHHRCTSTHTLSHLQVTPALGHLIILLSITGQTWEELASLYLSEGFDRNVRRIIKQYPELEDPEPDTKVDAGRISKSFSAYNLSGLRFLMMQLTFNK